MASLFMQVLAGPGPHNPISTSMLTVGWRSRYHPFTFALDVNFCNDATSLLESNCLVRARLYAQIAHRVWPFYWLCHEFFLLFTPRNLTENTCNPLEQVLAARYSSPPRCGRLLPSLPFATNTTSSSPSSTRIPPEPSQPAHPGNNLTTSPPSLTIQVGEEDVFRE
ncbi:hypothetical protein BDZ89DRAFT_686495 [Hymenopellis radicata]|nr:hypothetical protein BDZ89DRAFT_686495 [Hymenopellis radicata]